MRKELTTAIAMPKAISATASSKATTLSSVLVTGPSALYCFTTMIVAAGAVADAMAPKSKDTLASKPKRTKTPVTNTDASRASNSAMTIGVIPAFFRYDSLNSEPIENVERQVPSQSIEL